ncbi:MAG: hypothetical protein AB1633_12775, partial [Elusimicrobiota bacterium]
HMKYRGETRPLKVTFEIENNILSDVRFENHSDIHPSGALFALGRFLNGCELDNKKIKRKIEAFLGRNDIETPGIEAQDLANLFFKPKIATVCSIKRRTELTRNLQLERMKNGKILG